MCKRVILDQKAKLFCFINLSKVTTERHLKDTHKKRRM